MVTVQRGGQRPGREQVLDEREPAAGVRAVDQKAVTDPGGVPHDHAVTGLEDARRRGDGCPVVHRLLPMEGGGRRYCRDEARMKSLTSRRGRIS